MSGAVRLHRDSTGMRRSRAAVSHSPGRVPPTLFRWPFHDIRNECRKRPPSRFVRHPKWWRWGQWREPVKLSRLRPNCVRPDSSRRSRRVPSRRQRMQPPGRPSDVANWNLLILSEGPFAAGRDESCHQAPKQQLLMRDQSIQQEPNRADLPAMIPGLFRLREPSAVGQ